MKLRQVIATVVGITVLAGVSVVGAPYVATAYWHWQSGRDASTDSWESCEDPGTSVLFRAVAQDLTIDCPMDVWLGWLEEDLGRLGARPWASEFLAEPTATPLARARLNFALWRAFDRPPRHLPALLDSPAIPAGERDWMWAWLDEQDPAPSWVDVPLAQDIVGASFLDGDDVEPEQWLAWLWRGAAATGSMPDELRAEAVVRASQELHSAAPLFIERPLCADNTDACVRALVEVGEQSLQADARSWDGGPAGTEQRGDEPSLVLLSPLWRAKYAEDGSSHEAAAWWLRAVTAWARDTGDSGVLSVLASPVASIRSDSRMPGQWGDPAAVLGNRHGSPWATALAALTLGHSLDEDVSVGLARDAVEVSLAGSGVSVDACGRVQASPEVGVGVSDRQVLARAAVEAAGDALQRGDGPAASRLLGLAERAEGDSFGGFTQAVATEAATGAGHTLGTRIGRTSAPSEQAREWSEAWSALTDTECPPLLP